MIPVIIIIIIKKVLQFSYSHTAVESEFIRVLVHMCACICVFDTGGCV